MVIFAAPRHRYPTDRETWERETRPALLRTFTTEVYGQPVDADVQVSWQTLSQQDVPYGVRREIALTLAGPRGSTIVTLLVHLPSSRAIAPAFLGLNFAGNHATTPDPDVLDLSDADQHGGTLHFDHPHEHSTIPPRGSQARRWPYETVLQRGYAVVTASYLQCGPDHPAVFERGIHPTLERSGMTNRPQERWGAIGVWAWTLSRIQDAIVEGAVPEIDPAQIVVMGHSRLGKTALWAAAQDDRFAAAISNNSGAMGAALSRDVGETPEVLARIRPYWFARTFSERVLRGEPLPVDQHQLIACIAPRPVYVASASADLNADPEGEFLSWHEASSAWELYGHPPTDLAFPAPGERLFSSAPLGYHLRPGEHDVARFDWEQWMDFTDRWLPGSS